MEGLFVNQKEGSNRYTNLQALMIFVLILLPVGFAIWFGWNGYELKSLSSIQIIVAVGVISAYGFLANKIICSLKSESVTERLTLLNIEFSKTERNYLRAIQNIQKYDPAEIIAWVVTFLGLSFYLVTKKEMFILMVIMFCAYATILRNFRISAGILKKLQEYIKKLEKN